MELEGASDLQMELFKLGIEKGSELRGILGDQVIKYLDLKMAVNTLRKFKERVEESASDANVYGLSLAYHKTNDSEESINLINKLITL